MFKLKDNNVNSINPLWLAVDSGDIFINYSDIVLTQSKQIIWEESQTYSSIIIDETKIKILLESDLTLNNVNNL